MSAVLRRLAWLTFWPLNVLGVLVVVFGFVPMALLPMLLDAVDGLASWEMLGSSLVLCAVPIVSVVHAWRHRAHHREHPVDLLAFLMGMELPLVVLTAARLFGMQQMSGSAEILYSAIVVGGLVAEARAVFGERLPRQQFLDGLLHALLVMRATAGVYVGAVLATLTVPFIGLMVAEFVARPVKLLMFLLVAPLALLWLLVMVMPIATPIAWIHGVVRSGRAVREAWGLDDLLVTTISPLGALVVVVAAHWAQPHEGLLERLDPAPATDAERRALVDDRERVARGLLASYLARHTYVGDDDVDAWGRLWSLEGKLVHRSNLAGIDATMRNVARPFLYRGEWSHDARAAQRLYRQFFGRELERDHGAALRAALSARWDRDQRFAGFVDVGQARVRLASQDIDIRQDVPGVVAVELHDVWVNQTTTEQEVGLYFELPESAAVTGLWLGPTADKAEAFAHIVAPRGAAQQLYREEVRARRDPALLEQVGPRQYRLRVFPIPARVRASRDVWSPAYRDVAAPPVHVWLAYEAVPHDDGSVPLPLLRERRNGFWDDSAERRVTLARAAAAATETFVVDAVDAVDGGGWVQGVALPPLPRARIAAVVDDAGTCAALEPADAPPLPSLAGRVVDVVIDRSLAMGDRREELKAALATLAQSGAALSYVLGSSALRNEPPVVIDRVNAADVDGMVFFGAAQPKELLRQLLQVRGGALGDLVIVLAGEASFDVADDEALPLGRLPGGRLPRTLIVHVGGAMPAGYDDATLDAVRRSGGTASSNLRDALLRLQDTVWIDGVRFVPRVDDAACARTGPGRALVARQHILRADRGGKAPVEALDGLHGLAKSASVATPYSSLIVLVNDQQRARLARLSSEDDRFEREVEDDAKTGFGVSRLATALTGERSAAKRQTAQAPTAAAPTAAVDSAELRNSLVSTRAGSTAGSPAPTGAEAKDASVAAQKLEADAVKTNAVEPNAVEPNAVDGDALAAARDESDAPVAPSPTSVSGVPEPEEWLLLLLGLGVVGFVVLDRQRRRA